MVIISYLKSYNYLKKLIPALNSPTRFEMPKTNQLEKSTMTESIRNMDVILPIYKYS